MGREKFGEVFWGNSVNQVVGIFGAVFGEWFERAKWGVLGLCKSVGGGDNQNTLYFAFQGAF